MIRLFRLLIVSTAPLTSTSAGPEGANALYVHGKKFAPRDRGGPNGPTRGEKNSNFTMGKKLQTAMMRKPVDISAAAWGWQTRTGFSNNFFHNGGTFRAVYFAKNDFGCLKVESQNGSSL